MKVQNRFTLPPKETPETVREALQLFNYDVTKIVYIIGGAHTQLDLLTESDYPEEQRRKAIERGVINTLELCTEYLWNRIGDTDDVVMDSLPAGKPAKKIREEKP